MQRKVKIGDAIRDCLDTFPAGATRQDHLADFAERLSADPSWKPSEIHEVESTARMILARLKLGSQ